MIIAPCTLSERLARYRGHDQMFLLQKTIIFQSIIRNPIHHLQKQFRIVIDVVHHIFHFHEMDDHLRGNAVERGHGHPNGKNISECLLQNAESFFGRLQVHSIRRLFQFEIVGFQIFHNGRKFMSERIFQGVDVDGNLEQGEIGIIRDRM